MVESARPPASVVPPSVRTTPHVTLIAVDGTALAHGCTLCIYTLYENFRFFVVVPCSYA